MNVSVVVVVVVVKCLVYIKVWVLYIML